MELLLFLILMCLLIGVFGCSSGGHGSCIIRSRPKTKRPKAPKGITPQPPRKEVK